MVSDKEIKAAREAWREYWHEEDVPRRNTRDGITAALEAAARVRAEGNSVAGSEGTENSFILRAVGDIEDLADDLKGDRGVILEGSAEAIREAGKLWGERVRIIAASAHPAPQPSGTVKVDDIAAIIYSEMEWASALPGDPGEPIISWDDCDDSPAFAKGRARAAARRILSALTAGKPEQSGWQPIETAPKDGTPVLLARFDRPGFTDDDLGPDGATVGHWAHFPSGNGGWYLSGLGVVGDYGGDYHPGNGAFSNNGWPELDPTHWMALPAAPTAGGGE